MGKPEILCAQTDIARTPRDWPRRAAAYARFRGTGGEQMTPDPFPARRGRAGVILMKGHRQSLDKARGAWYFRFGLICALLLTLLSLAVCVLLTVWGLDTDRARSLFETCQTTGQMGFGALLGLIGGNALTDKTARPRSG
jgi:hypothetical protein